MMKEKPYTLLTVRMPPDLQNVLETISRQLGEFAEDAGRAC